MSKRDLTPEDLFIPKPCTVELDPATAGQKRRYCGECKQHVWDTSKMTREEVDALLEREDVCIVTAFRGDELQLAEETEEETENVFWGAIGGAVAAGVAWMAISTFSAAPEPARFDLDSLPDAPAVAGPLVPDAPAVVQVDLPENLSKAERAYIYRLKTEYGISIEGDKTLTAPPDRPRTYPKTLSAALEDLEVIQQKRDTRTGGGSSTIKMKTYREVIEDLEVIQMGRVRRVRGKIRPPRKSPSIEIIKQDD